MRRRPASPDRTIAVLIYEDGQSLDVSGPVEVFALAARELQERDASPVPAYTILTVAVDATPVRMSSGLRVVPDLQCAALQGGRGGRHGIDTLLVSGGMGDALDRARGDRQLVDWLRHAAAAVRRIGSVCSGALLLAEAGLLDGRAATTHWRDVPELVRRYPRVRVQHDAIYTRDGEVWTSAGITAGMDMALAMVAADHGAALALDVATRMVLPMRRSGGQSQFSRQLHALDPADPFCDLVDWLDRHAHRPIEVEHLAAQLHLSPRQFARRFKARFGTTPRAYLEAMRINRAKALLEATGKSLERIAGECGFSSADTLRRAFGRAVGTTPVAYRARLAGR